MTVFEAAVEAVENDPNSTLSCFGKQQIWNALAPHTKGHSARFALAKQAVEHVLPLWDSVLPLDQTPKRLLETAESAHSKIITKEQAMGQYRLGWNHSDSIASNLSDTAYHVSLVCNAACRVIIVALFDDSCADYSIEADPYSFDAAEHAAAAFSHGHVGHPNSDKELRRKFWLWYIRKATEISAHTH